MNEKLIHLILASHVSFSLKIPLDMFKHTSAILWWCSVCECSVSKNTYLETYLLTFAGPEEDFRHHVLIPFTLLPWGRVSHWAWGCTGGNSNPPFIDPHPQSWDYRYICPYLTYSMCAGNLTSNPHAFATRTLKQ